MTGKKKNKTNQAIKEILEILAQTYPDAQCELVHQDSFQLLIATILSAQTTDKKVNQVTKGLFSKYKSPQDFLKASQEELESEIKEIGLYRSKAKNILSTCKILAEQYHGQVPSNREDLMSLPGVGRKTANVVLSNAFHVPAIAVDTHVFRVSNRIGFADADNVQETENQLMATIPEKQWSHAHHLLIFHGRRICDARRPKCDVCPIVGHCRHYREISAKPLVKGKGKA